MTFGMRLTEQTRYAVRVLAACAKVHPHVVSVKRVAADTGLTEFTIFKLLKTATKAGLVASMRGRNGGIRLAMEPEQLTLGSVVRAFELRFQECRPVQEMLAEDLQRDCVDRQLNGMIGQGFAAFLRTMDEMTIADLLNQCGCGVGLMNEIGSRRPDPPPRVRTPRSVEP